MIKITSILAILLLLTTVSLAGADKVTINYPPNLRELVMEVEENYSFKVSIKNGSDENMEVMIELENANLMNLTVQEKLILGPNQGINVLIVFSLRNVGEFSEILKVALIGVGENTSRKGSACRIKLEGVALAKKGDLPWVLALILSILGALVAIILYILKKILKR